MTNKWLYLDAADNSQRGPIDQSTMKRLLKRGVVHGTTFVWTDSQADWLPLQQLPDFTSFLNTLNTLWHYLTPDNTNMGPISTVDLMKLFGDGDIDGITLVWNSSMDSWKPLGEIAELKEFLQEAIAEQERESLLFEQQNNIAMQDQIFEKSTDTSSYIADDGKQYVYDSETKKFITPTEKIEEELQTLHDDQQEEATEARENTELDTETRENVEGEEVKKKKKKKKRKKKDAWTSAKQNTWVYVNGLPLDITVDEVAEHFGKCGVIQKDLQADSKPRIKLYQNKTHGGLNGDASVCYMKEASVELAVQILDKAEIREGWPLDVSAAVFNQKGDKYVAKKAKLDGRAKVKKFEQMKTLSWNDGGEDEEKGLKIVTLKRMFTPEQANVPNFIQELEEDIVGECSALGDIEKITIFEKNVMGVVILKFKNSGSATKCVEVMNKRFFGGTQIECEFWDGTDYTYRETESELKKRSDNFGAWLEGGSSDDDEEDDEEQPPPMIEEHEARQMPLLED